MNTPDAGTGPDSTPGTGQAPRERKRILRPRSFLIAGAGLAAVAVVCAGIGFTATTGVPLALKVGQSVSSMLDSNQASRYLDTTNGSTGSGTTTTPEYPGYGSYGSYGSNGGTRGGTGSGSTGSGTGTGSTSASTAATDAQSVGVVLIDTELKYQSAAAAGTGIILTSDGEILTNNHVIEGSTSITVTIASTGKTYTATVIGTDATEDVAVLKLDGASGLTPAKLDTSETVAVGDAITGVGNAGGTGSLSAAAGTVTALDQQVTTQAEGSSAGETLDGMIQVAAGIQSGDSGGPLYDADGEVIGIDTAASTGTTNVTGFAIPITTALSVAKQIESGVESGTVSIGYPAFLGIEVASDASSATGGLGGSAGGSTGSGASGGTTSTVAGATVAGVIADTPAATSGLVAGDVITAVDGTAVASGTELTTTLQAHNPGDTVTITYTDATGTSQSVSVTLIQGPAA